MTGFNSNFSDIQRQISFANLTDEQIPSGKHTSGGYSLGHINGYHHNISDFMYLYHGVSSKFPDYYLALFYWIEKNKHKPYLEQAYDIITLLVIGESNFLCLMLAKF